MAITAQQRQMALTYILAAAVAAAGISSPMPLDTLLPGFTPQQVLSDAVAAVGTAFDTNLDTALANLVAYLNTQLTTAQAGITSLQSEITQATVV